EAQRVVDPAARDLVVAGEARQDRQPRSVGRRPAGGAQAVRPEVPDRAGAGMPAPARAAEGVELVERARVAVDDDRVAVAATLAKHVRRDRVRPTVALARVVETD